MGNDKYRRRKETKIRHQQTSKRLKHSDKQPVKRLQLLPRLFFFFLGGEERIDATQQRAAPSSNESVRASTDRRNRRKEAATKVRNGKRSCQKRHNHLADQNCRATAMRRPPPATTRLNTAEERNKQQGSRSFSQSTCWNSPRLLSTATHTKKKHGKGEEEQEKKTQTPLTHIERASFSQHAWVFSPFFSSFRRSFLSIHVEFDARFLSPSPQTSERATKKKDRASTPLQQGCGRRAPPP